jgi:hypothetical protein
MKDKHPKQAPLNEEELQLIEQLREHPKLMERFKNILEITTSTEGPLKRADQVEELLIEEMRRLGNTSMGSWAARTERSLTEQLKQKDSSASVRKKTLRWWCVFGLVSVEEWVWRTNQKRYLRLLPGGHWRRSAKPLPALGASINRFRLRALVHPRSSASTGALWL